MSTISRAYADDSNGKRHYMGVAECERDDIVQFKTLGAKKYAYLTKSCELKVTTSGVNKKKAPKELLKNKSPDESVLDVYTPGFVFEDAGGNRKYRNRRA